MDDEDVLVQQLVKSLAFEVEAVAAENIVKFSTTGTPLNVKVRVRNKDEPRLVQRGLVSVPRIGNQLTAPEKIRLISSDQTILSFNVYMETDLVKETQTPKSRKHGFNFLKFGGCLGTSVGEDDDKGAYVPETSNKRKSGIIIDEIEGSQEKVKLNMENSKIVTRNQKGFFGKCKPGGCLDPPFGEDKYPYGLPKTQHQPTPNLSLNKHEETKDNRSYSISSFEPRKLSKLTDEPIKKGQQPSRSEVESKPLVDIFARTSSSQNSLGSNHSNIITYPPRLSSSELIRDNQDTKKRNKSKSFNESPRQSNEHPVAYFVPPKDTLRQKEEERRYSRELSSDQIRINDDSVKDATSRNNGSRKRALRNRSFETSSINNAKFAEMKPIAGREEYYPKRVKQTSTDLTLNSNDNVPKIPLQGRKKSDIVLITPHVDQIDNIKNPKKSEIKPIAVSASQGSEENYPKRVEQTSTDATSNDKDNVQITPLQRREKKDILVLTPHVDQIEITKNPTISEIKPIAVSASKDREENNPKRVEQTSTDVTLDYKDNVRITPLQGREKNDMLLLTPQVDQVENVFNAKFTEIKPMAVSASQGREENHTNSIKQNLPDLTLNDKVNERILPLQERKKSDILLPTPHMDQIKHINHQSKIILQSVPVTGSNNLDDFDNKDDSRFQIKSQLHSEGTLDYGGINSENMFKKLGDKKDILYDSKDKTKEYKIMPSAQALESGKDQKLEHNEIPTEPQSQSKKTKLTLKTNPNFSSSLQNLLDTSELNKVVSDTSSQNTQSKAKKDTNTYPSTSAEADKTQSFPNKSEATKSQTQKIMYENQNKNNFILLSNTAEVSESIDPEQPKQQDFSSSDADPIKSRSDREQVRDMRTQEAYQDNRVKETSKTVDPTLKSDTITKIIEDTDIFNKQTYSPADSTNLKTEISNGTIQDQNNQLNNLDTLEFRNKVIDGKRKEQDNERIANIYGSTEDNLSNADIDSIKSNAYPDKQNVINNFKMPMFSSQTKNEHNNRNDVGISESHVIKPFMIVNGEQSIDDHMSQTQSITDISTEKHQTNKKLQKTASHDSTASKNKEFATYSAHSLDSHEKITSTYDDTKKPVNIQHDKDKSSGPKIVKPSSVDHVIIQNDLVFNHNEIPQFREKRSSLVKMPFAATGSDLRSDEASKMIPLKHKAFPIVESNKSVEKQIEEISILQNLETENHDKSVPRGQAQERVLDGREIELVGRDSALNLTDLDKQAKTLLLDSDKNATEIIGLSRKGNKTNVNDADSTYFQPKLPITETERGKIIQNQLTSGFHQDYAPVSLGLPSDDTNQVDYIGFKSPEPFTPNLNIDNTTENISDSRIGMDREGDSETKKQDLMENMEKLPTSANDQYFKELLINRNAKLATKSSTFNDMNISQSKVNQLADQLSSKIITDEINEEVKTLPLNYTLEDGTSKINPTMEKTYIGTAKISSAITHQETSDSSNIMANSARQDNPQLSTTAVGKTDSEFNAANLNYADTETLNLMHETKTYDDMTTITSAPLKATVGDYNLEKTVPQFDEFTDDTIIKRLGLGFKKDVNNKNVQKQKDMANFMKKSDSKIGRSSKKSIDETRRILLNVTKPSNNKSTPLSKYLETDSMNKTNLESLDISAIPTEKDKFELLLNMKFQTYVNENNHIVVQTLNPLTEAQDLESDKVTVVNSLIRPGNEINIHVDSEHNLTLGLNDNYHMNGYQNHDELKAYQHVSPDATENEIVLYKNLTLLYETELVPLHNAIISLTEEINALSVNQELLKAKLQGAKRNRSTRISPVNRHCGCRRS